MSFNPKRLTGNFVICDDKFKAKHGSKPFEFGPHQWGRLELWNAVEVMTPSFDLNVLLERMQHEDYTIRTQNHRIWMKKILEAILKSLGDKQFMHGEGSYNGPKIHAKTYKKGLVCWNSPPFLWNTAKKLLRGMLPNSQKVKKKLPNKSLFQS